MIDYLANQAETLNPYQPGVCWYGVRHLKSVSVNDSTRRIGQAPVQPCGKPNCPLYVIARHRDDLSHEDDRNHPIPIFRSYLCDDHKREMEKQGYVMQKVIDMFQDKRIL